MVKFVPNHLVTLPVILIASSPVRILHCRGRLAVRRDRVDRAGGDNPSDIGHWLQPGLQPDPLRLKENLGSQ